MAKKAAAVKQWLSNRKRFANLYNVSMFRGEEIIKPEELEPVEGETHILIETKDGKTQEIHRYRDITMRWNGEMDLLILACENQDKVHYAMPVRVMIYDGLSYAQQMKGIWELREETEKISSDEFLSRFHKEDKICPVVTLVFYFGEDEWDASQDLYGMFDMEEVLRRSDVLREYIPNYKINLVDASRIENLELFQTDLQVVFGLLKCRKDKIKLKSYIEKNKNYLKSMDIETGMVIGTVMNSDKIIECVLKQKEGDEIDMCKAMEDWATEEREQGIEQGIDIILVEQIKKKLKKGKSIIQIADEIEETEERVEHLIEKYEL